MDYRRGTKFLYTQNSFKQLYADMKIPNELYEIGETIKALNDLDVGERFCSCKEDLSHYTQFCTASSPNYVR